MATLIEECNGCSIFVSPILDGLCLFVGYFFVVGPMLTVMVISFELAIDF